MNAHFLLGEQESIWQNLVKMSCDKKINEGLFFQIWGSKYLVMKEFSRVTENE